LTNYLLGLDLRASNFFFNALRRNQNVNKTEIIRRAINPTVKPAYCGTERDLPLRPAEEVPEPEYSPGIEDVKLKEQCCCDCGVFDQTSAKIQSSSYDK